MQLIRESWLVFERSLILSLRNPVWFFIGLMQPLTFLILFGPLLERFTGVPGFPAARSWTLVFVPGLLVQLTLFSAYAGFGLLQELRAGVVERMRVTPVHRMAILLGRALRDVVAGTVEVALLVAAAVPFGLQPKPVPVLVVVGLLALVGLTLATMSYALALLLRTDDALAQLLNLISMPLLLLSGIFLPMSLAPDWLQAIARVNPFYHAVEAARAAFADRWSSPELLTAFVLFAILAALSVWASSRVVARAVS